jgi:hypothetical protein
VAEVLRDVSSRETGRVERGCDGLAESVQLEVRTAETCITNFAFSVVVVSPSCFFVLSLYLVVIDLVVGSSSPDLSSSFREPLRRSISGLDVFATVNAEPARAIREALM